MLKKKRIVISIASMFPTICNYLSSDEPVLTEEDRIASRFHRVKQMIDNLEPSYFFPVSGYRNKDNMLPIFNPSSVRKSTHIVDRIISFQRSIEENSDSKMVIVSTGRRYGKTAAMIDQYLANPLSIPDLPGLEHKSKFDITREDLLAAIEKQKEIFKTIKKPSTSRLDISEKFKKSLFSDVEIKPWKTVKFE